MALGVITRVGTVDPIDTGIEGLFSIGNTLYGFDSQEIYSYNLETGAQTRVGILVTSNRLANKIAAIGNTLYIFVMPRSGNTRRLETATLSNLRSTFVADIQNQSGENVPDTVGAFFSDGTGLFFTVYQNDADDLYSLTTGGVFTLIGETGENFINSVAVGSDTAYFVSSDGLHTLNLSNAATTLLASMPSSPGENSGLEFIGGTLYYVRNGILYTIDLRPSLNISFTNVPTQATGNFSIIADFQGTGTITGVDRTDFGLTHVSGEPLVSSGLSDFTINGPLAGTNNYRINFTPAENIEGSYTINVDSGSEVTHDGVANTIADASATLNINTLYPTISANISGGDTVFSSGFELDVLFTGTEPITGLTKSDFLLTHVSGDELDDAHIDRFTVHADTSNNRRYLLDFPLVDNVAGTFNIGFNGNDAVVQVAGVNHRATGTAQSVSFDSRLGSITPTFVPPAGTQTNPAGFDVRVDFPTNDAVTGFNLSNVVTDITPDAQDPDYSISIVAVPNDLNSFILRFAPQVSGVSGTLTLDLQGEVLVGGRRRNIDVPEINIGFAVPAFVRATMTGPSELNEAGNFTIRIEFDSRQRITGFQNADIEVTRLSGSNLNDAGLNNFVRSRVSDTVFQLTFTLRSHVTGLFSVAIDDGEVDIQGIGDDFDIVATTLNITYNTIPALGVTANVRQIPTQLLEPGDVSNIALDEYIFGNITSLTLSNQPAWVILSGTNTDGPNRTLQIAPPSNFSVSQPFSSIQFMMAVVNNAGSVPMDIYVHVFRPIEPVDIVYWDIPEPDMGAIRGQTTVVSVIFNRAFVAPDTLLVSDIRLDGVTGVTVTDVSVDPLNNRKYDITLAISLGAIGNLEINII